MNELVTKLALAGLTAVFGTIVKMVTIDEMTKIKEAREKKQEELATAK